MRAVSRPVEGFTNEVELGSHGVLVDEPEETGGNNRGPTPQQLLAAALASCTAITVQMYAGRKGWQLEGFEVAVDYEPEAKGECSRFEVILRLPKELGPDQLERLEVIAGKCPVHRTLAGDIAVSDRVELL